MGNYFFSGYVIGKIPFPLTPSFKGMLQRGVNISSLDTSYITSMSWYFLVMSGMRGLFSLVLGANNDTDDSKIMQQQMGMGAAQPGQQPDMNKIFAAEAENLQMIDHNTKNLRRTTNEPIRNNAPLRGCGAPHVLASFVCAPASAVRRRRAV